ncbi:hypothetical protein LUZ63_000603 [Rhynchospora breviuscula]|uniref:Peptidase A1 domain-containing protein n=1 Tax=Rhynchospora breviuscula TaxID=2022672 RepID=A0A9Q0CV85_9POAL|nr:hypothetical protein LUZ63_000603 [Rhynchospora breviuscula]
MHRLSRLKRMQLLSSTNVGGNIHSEGPTLAEYYMDLAIGNPPLQYSAFVDTGSDLIWTQCSTCKKCLSQPTPLYNRLESTTVSSIPWWTSGTLDKETFTFGTTNSKYVSVPNIVFGCSTSSSDEFNGSAGLVGLSRVEVQYNQHHLLETLQARTTLSLQGISLGTAKLAIRPAAIALKSDGTGGMIIDSGTTFTVLVNEAYLTLQTAIKSIVKLPLANYNGSNIGNDLCYSV